MRSTTKLMKNWQFTGPDGKTAAVDLPHTWTNIDGQDGQARLLARHLHLQDAVHGARF